MIAKLSFRNFKSLVDVDVELERFTVLVGPNGSGKSSVLQATDLLARFAVEQPGEGRHSSNRFGIILHGLTAAERLATHGGKGPLTVQMQSDDGERFTLSVEFEKQLASHQPAQTEFNLIHVDRKSLTRRVSVPNFSHPAPQSLFDPAAVSEFGSAVYLHLDATLMAKTSFRDEEAPTMSASGEGLASSLAVLAGSRPEVLDAIAQSLAKVVPGVRKIRTYRERAAILETQQVTINGSPYPNQVLVTRIGDRFSIEFEGGSNVPADLLSEGTVLALGLVTKLHEPNRPRLILLDDVDRGLHPTAQQKLVETLRALLAANPDLQIVATSHSPDLLSQFKPEEVRVLALDAERRTHCRKLTEHPEFEKVKFGFQTGEIWSYLGEN